MPDKTTAKSERPRILVVDDEEIVRRTIRLALEPDYEIIEAASIAESLKAFDQQEPDLITLDIYLPEVDGMQGLLHFRQRSAKIPIILVSGYATFKLAQEALRLGATDYLTKPFTREELRQTLETALRKASSPEELGPQAPDASSNLKLRLPLHNLQENKFFSGQHRSNFLAFAQNALSPKKRAFERISLNELVKTVSLQFKTLNLERYVPYKIVAPDSKLRMSCDMYLLGGALANLALACMLETREDPSTFTLRFNPSETMLQVVYKKSQARLPESLLARYKHWQQHPTTALDANTAIVILAENAVHQHQGQFVLNTSSDQDFILEISLPLSGPSPS